MTSGGQITKGLVRMHGDVPSQLATAAAQELGSTVMQKQSRHYICSISPDQHYIYFVSFSDKRLLSAAKLAPSQSQLH